MCAFTACIRFLRRRGPAGLRSLLFFGYSVVIFAPPCSLSQTWKHSCSNGWTHTLPQTRPKTTWKSRMRAGMLPSPKESHTAAHKGKQGVLLCRGARQYSKPEESDVHLRLLSRAKAGTHSALLKGSHTAAHTPKQGASLPRPQCGFVLPAKSPPKEQPEKADARLWRASASSGVAAPLDCATLFSICPCCISHARRTGISALTR